MSESGLAIERNREKDKESEKKLIGSRYEQLLA